MAKKSKTKSKKTKGKSAKRRRFDPILFVWLWGTRLVMLAVVVIVLVVAAHSVVNPPRNIYMSQEAKRLGGIDHEWVPMEEIPDVMERIIKSSYRRPRSVYPDIPRALQEITRRCLEKKPERRYGSAAALSDDVGRFLNNEAINARPATAISWVGDLASRSVMSRWNGV